MLRDIYATVHRTFFILIKMEETEMSREGKRCVLYPRVSTEMQVDGWL